MDDSPCINECVLNEDDVCLGCGRKIEEIINWKSMTEEQKERVLERLEEQEE